MRNSTYNTISRLPNPNPNPHSPPKILNMNNPNSVAAWSWPDNKIFEDALAKFPEELPDRWQKIAALLPGKSPHDVLAHYEALLHDVADIEAGRVQVPTYPELTETRRRSQCERKKGKPWTVREHMLFLRGLEIYGKSDWRSISRNVVISRLPSQVASHAQKYFNRLNLVGKKERKRSSIHDITSLSDCPRDFAFQECSDDTNTNSSSALDYLALPETPDSQATLAQNYSSQGLGFGGGGGEELHYYQCN